MPQVATNSVSCPGCHYPIGTPALGDQVKCPYCGEISQAIAMEVPNTVVVGLACFFGGVLLGPAVYQVMQGASAWLARQAREKIK